MILEKVVGMPHGSHRYIHTIMNTIRGLERDGFLISQIQRLLCKNNGGAKAQQAVAMNSRILLSCGLTHARVTDLLSGQGGGTSVATLDAVTLAHSQKSDYNSLFVGSQPCLIVVYSKADTKVLSKMLRVEVLE